MTLIQVNKKVFEKEVNLQNPEVFEPSKVHFGDSSDVVPVQVPADRNTDFSWSKYKNKIMCKVSNI